ncbi:type IV conjugative transfer system protein TraL [Thalassospira xiamenensis]|nr:type IV conjugative transfer system protein TraL [Thalassospira xiamenensis]
MSEQNENEYRMPKRVNDPPTLFVFPVHQVAAFFMFAGVGIVFGNTMFFLILGVASFYTINWAEKKYAPGIITHWLYWNDLALHVNPNKYIPSALKREFFQ